MANISIADQLDDAIEMIIAEPDSAPTRVDLKIGALLGIAAELRLLPDPGFRAALKAELLGQVRTLPVAATGQTAVTARKQPGAERIEPANEVLPSLFAAGAESYPVHRANFGISLALHATLIALFVAVGVMAKQPGLTPQVTTTLVTDMRAYLPSGRNSGGGAHDRTAESKGQLPRLAREQLVPPAIVVRSEEPKLPVDATTIIGTFILTFPTSPVRNPLSTILGPPSNGTGSGGGIGAGYGSGVGSESGTYVVGGGVSAPRAIYDPDPEYSEEARQAKYQGSVFLWVVVGADGRAHEIRVQRSLGMGLDEKAIEAVRRWRFEPSIRNGLPVASQVTIEVSFRLL